jgi:hypothetical protein
MRLQVQWNPGNTTNYGTDVRWSCHQISTAEVPCISFCHMGTCYNKLTSANFSASSHAFLTTCMLSNMNHHHDNVHRELAKG